MDGGMKCCTGSNTAGRRMLTSWRRRFESSCRALSGARLGRGGFATAAAKQFQNYNQPKIPAMSRPSFGPEHMKVAKGLH
jgi:hypothetical protein